VDQGISVEQLGCYVRVEVGVFVEVGGDEAAKLSGIAYHGGGGVEG